MDNQAAVNEQYRGDLDPVRTGLQLIPIMTAKKKNFFITHPDEEAFPQSPFYWSATGNCASKVECNGVGGGSNIPVLELK